MQKRPVSATVFGILNIVFAVYGLCCLAASLPAFFNPNMVKDDPIMKILEDNEFYFMFAKFQLAGGLLFSLVLAIGGIGLLLLRSWGRTLSICYGAYAILGSSRKLGL